PCNIPMLTKSFTKYVIDKYVNKEFIVQKDEKNGLSNSVDLAFWKAMGESNLYEALRCLSLGANVDWKNDQENYTTALHQAILRSDDIAVEFLLSWSCDINEVDKKGWSCLHHAAATNNARLLLILMKRHANINLKDINGKRPVDIAVELQKVQAVTVLRLYQFENQLTRSEYSNFGVGEALNSISKPYAVDTLYTEPIYTEADSEYIYLPNNTYDEQTIVHSDQSK
ncbi:4298_t:CDS:2, partial [Scutellospora calospora]